MRIPPSLQERFSPEVVLGEGGFGRVLRCHDSELDRPVALKLLTLDGNDESAQRRFLREAKSTARVRHPHVVEVLDFGVDESSGEAFVVYPHVPGEDLARALQAHGPLATEELAAIGGALADALAACAEAGVVHRDVKPANVMLRGPGDPVLVDFGLASLSAAGTQLTPDGLILGTPGYMAPEVLVGGPPTAAADQFALAATLAVLAGGEGVHGSHRPGDVVRAVAGGRSPGLDAAARARLGVLAAPVSRALAARPPGRWPDAAAFAAALRTPEAAHPRDGERTRIVGSPPLAQPPEPAPGRRSWWPALALGLGGILLGGALALRQPGRPEPNPAGLAPSAPLPDLEEPARELAQRLPANSTLHPLLGLHPRELAQTYQVLIASPTSEPWFRLIDRLEITARAGGTLTGPLGGERSLAHRALLAVSEGFRTIGSRVGHGRAETASTAELFGIRASRGFPKHWEPTLVRIRREDFRKRLGQLLCSLEARPPDSRDLHLWLVLDLAASAKLFVPEDDTPEACHASIAGRAPRLLTAAANHLRQESTPRSRQSILEFLARLDDSGLTRCEPRRQVLRALATGPVTAAEEPWLRQSVFLETWSLAFFYPEQAARLVPDLEAAFAHVLRFPETIPGTAARARRMRESHGFRRVPEVAAMARRLDALVAAPGP